MNYAQATIYLLQMTGSVNIGNDVLRSIFGLKD